jgi:hypothetical protein
VRLPSSVRRFVDEKFPQDKLQRRLIALAFAVGPILYFANWYITARLWWELFHESQSPGLSF